MGAGIGYFLCNLVLGLGVETNMNTSEFDYYILVIHRVGKPDIYFPKPSHRDNYGVDCTEDIDSARRWLRIDEVQSVADNLRMYVWKYGAIGNDERWANVSDSGYECEIVGCHATDQLSQYEKYEFREGDFIVWKGQGKVVGKIQGVFAGSYHICDGCRPSKPLCRPATADEIAMIKPGKKFAKIRLPFEEMGHWVHEQTWIAERVQGIFDYDTYGINIDHKAYFRRIADIILEMELEIESKGGKLCTEGEEEE